MSIIHTKELTIIISYINYKFKLLLLIIISYINRKFKLLFLYFFSCVCSFHNFIMFGMYTVVNLTCSMEEYI